MMVWLPEKYRFLAVSCLHETGLELGYPVLNHTFRAILRIGVIYLRGP